MEVTVYANFSLSVFLLHFMQQIEYFTELQ